MTIFALFPLAAPGSVHAQASAVLEPNQLFAGDQFTIAAVDSYGPNVVAVQSTGDARDVGDWNLVALESTGDNQYQLQDGTRYFGERVFTHRVRFMLRADPTAAVAIAGGSNGFYAQSSPVEDGFDPPGDPSIANPGGGSIAFGMSPADLVRARRVYLSAGHYTLSTVQYDQVRTPGTPDDEHQNFALIVVPPTDDFPVGILSTACDLPRLIPPPEVVSAGYTCPAESETATFAQRIAAALGRRALDYAAPTDGWYTLVVVQADHNVTNSVTVTVTPAGS